MSRAHVYVIGEDTLKLDEGVAMVLGDGEQWHHTHCAGKGFLVRPLQKKGRTDLAIAPITTECLHIRKGQPAVRSYFDLISAMRWGEQIYGHLQEKHEVLTGKSPVLECHVGKMFPGSSLNNQSTPYVRF